MSDDEHKASSAGGEAEVEAADGESSPAPAEPTDVKSSASEPEGSDAGPGSRDRSARPWRVMMAETPLWKVVAQLLLAPLLAAGAVGVHWWLNVPDQIIESPHDQKARKKKKKKPRRKPGKRDKSAQQDRSPQELEAERDRYASVSLEEEPVRPAWARRHQALINRAVVLARRDAFEGAPEKPRVVLSDTKCHTVRCRFTLRSKYPHALEAVGDTLGRLQSGDEGVWHGYERTVASPLEGHGDAKPKGEPKGEPKSDQEHHVQITVSFRIDTTDSRSMSIRPLPVVDTGARAEAEGAGTGERSGA